MLTQAYGQSMQHHKHQKMYTSQAQAKTKLICFYYKGTVPFEFLVQCQKMKQHCYLKILARLCGTFVREDLNFDMMLGLCVMTSLCS
jgi:hypothetical protein